MTRFVCYIFTNSRTLLVCSRTFLSLSGSTPGSSRSVRLARGSGRILFGSFLFVTSRTRTKFVREFTSRTRCSRARLGSGAISDRSYDSSVPVIVPSIPRGKCPRPPSSDSESSDGEDINEFTNYLATKRDKSVKDPLAWWFKSQSIFPKLSKMAHDVYAVPATGAGVEREFSISGRVITKQRNRLSPSTIRDLMQYK